MKKLINIFLMLAVMLVFTPVAYGAASNVLTLSAGSQVLLDGKTFSITGSVDEIIAYSNYFTLELSLSSSATITSADKYMFTVSPSNINVEYACNANTSVLTLTGIAEEVFTITPLDTVCDEVSSSGGGSAGGGGGGGASAPAAAAPSAAPTAPAIVADNVSSGGAAVTLAEAVSQAVTASEGGQVTLSDNSIAVSLPAAAVSTEATVSVTPQSTYPQPSAGYSAVGSQVYNITAQTTGGASITQLNNSATVTFNYTDAQITGLNESTLVVSYWDENTGSWLNLPTTINTASNTVTATVDHFSLFILQGKSNTAPPGSLAKTANNSAVFYIGHDSKRYVFRDDKTFFTWYANFDDVITISTEAMNNFSLGGSITVRAGTKLAQFVSYNLAGQMVIDDPKIYAVELNGNLRWIETGEVAAALYGSNWEQKIIPVNNTLFGYYVRGDSISQAAYPTGALVKETLTNDLYYVSAGQKRLVTTNGVTSNNFQSAYYQSATSLSGYETTTALNAYQNSIGWVGGK